MSERSRGDAVSELFSAAIERTPDEREAFVENAETADPVRREVLSLLTVYERAQAQPDQLDAGLAAAVLGGDEARSSETEAGRLIGPWRVLRELGRGGMGVVYLAERADGAYEQQVAIKLLPAALGSEALADRFRLERQILAGLEHPGIARMLDGGVADHGEPYIVLEYVEGEPITGWCDRRRSTVSERLRLFTRVCEAVQFAHARLVVHRDLKPSNVLVTDEGKVKLLDFGIAKLLADDGRSESTILTQAGMRPYTPGYAAPEQLRGEPVTVATDVYGLGTLLYELLCGRRPHDADIPERRAQADWIEPKRPSSHVDSRPDDGRRGGGLSPSRVGSGNAVDEESQGSRTANDVADVRRTTPERLQRRLAGDLDTIALKALREEPEQRYDSVQALADDIDRHRRGLPIAARPASVSYRTGKFLRRHWVGATAAALVAIAILAGLAGTIWQARVAQRERDAAQAEAAKAEQVAEFLADVFRQANPLESKGEEMTVREALDRGAERIEEELADQPIVQAELMAVLGGTYLELGDYEPAGNLIQRALELRRQHLGPDHLDVAETLRGLGLLRYQQGDYRGAVRLYNEGVAIVEGNLGPEALDLAGLLNNLGITYRRTGDYEAGVAAYERALAIRERHLGPNHLDVGRVSLNLGTLLSVMREDDRALAAYERALTVYERELGPEHPYVAGALGNIALIRMRREDFDGLEDQLRRVVAIHEKAYGPVHDYVATGLNILGEFLAATDRSEEAEKTFRRAAEVYRQALGADHPHVAYPLSNLGDFYSDNGRFEEAVAVFEQALRIRQAAHGNEHRLVAQSWASLGAAQRDSGDLHAAETGLQRALTIHRILEERDDEGMVGVATDLAGVLIEQARCDEARTLLSEASEIVASIDAADFETAAEIDALLARCPA